MDGRSTHRKGGQATQQVRPESVRPGAGFLARKDRSAHIADARFPATRPASAYGLNPRYIARITRFREDAADEPARGQGWCARYKHRALVLTNFPLYPERVRGDCRGPRLLIPASTLDRSAPSLTVSHLFGIAGHQCPVPALLTLMEFSNSRQAPWRLARCHGATIGVMTTRLAVLVSFRIARPAGAA